MNAIDTTYQRIVTALKPYKQAARIELAAKTGISQWNIAMIRDGRNTNPTREVMSKLCDALFEDSSGQLESESKDSAMR